MPNFDESACDRCGRTFDPIDDMRMWSGSYTETVDGVTAEYDTLCDDCHRDIVRQ